MLSGITLAYLNQLVPSLVQTQSQYSLRNSNNVLSVHANSTLYYNSFLPSVIRAWNNLPIETRNSTSLTEFKRKLAVNMNKPPNYFYWTWQKTNSTI